MLLSSGHLPFQAFPAFSSVTLEHSGAVLTSPHGEKKEVHSVPVQFTGSLCHVFFHTKEQFWNQLILH